MNSRSGDSRGRNLSECRRKLTERGAHTSWRRRREGVVRTRKETDRTRCTHALETAEKESCQDPKRNRPSQVHSHSEDGRRKGLSGHGKKQTERRTHLLETAEGGACQDTERNRSSEADPLPGDGRGRDLSGHTKKPTERGALTSCRRQKGLVRT